MLAEMGQLTIRDYLRRNNLESHEQVLAGDVEDEASCAGQIGRCDPARASCRNRTWCNRGALCSEFAAGNSGLAVIVP